MTATKVTVVGIITLLIGVGTGYLLWGSEPRQLAGELAAAKARLAEAQQSAAREGAVATKLQQAEAQLKQMTETLRSERELREKLDALVSKKK